MKIIITVLTIFVGLQSFATTFTCEQANQKIEVEHPEGNTGTFITTLKVFKADQLIEEFSDLRGQFDENYGMGPNREIAMTFNPPGKHLTRIWHGNMSNWYIYDLDGIRYNSWANGPNLSNCRVK